MSSQQAPPGQMPQIHYPHLAPVAVMGGTPNKTVDVPVSAVFLVLFLSGAVIHMTLFQINMRRKHKFILSAVVFGFCMSRIATTSLRIAWACHPNDVNVAIASQVFNNAGVVLLFIVNLIFAQRILRAVHPRFVWNKPFSIGFKAYYASLVGVLIIVVTSTVLSFYTIDPKKQDQYGKMRKFGIIYFAVFSLASLIVLIATFLIPTRQEREKLGKRGSLRTQITVVAVASVLLAFGAIFRSVTAFFPPRPINNPAWWHSKAFFYNIYFTIEILVVYLYAIARIDQLFHIPDKKDRIAARDGKSTTSNSTDVVE